MSSALKRGIAAACAFAVAAAVNVATGVLTQDWSIAAWVCLGVLVVVGGALQLLLTMGEQGERGAQRVRGLKARKARQHMSRPGTQHARDIEVTGDFEQRQDG